MVQKQLLLQDILHATQLPTLLLMSNWSYHVRSRRSHYTVQLLNWDLEEAAGEGIQSNADENGDVMENFERALYIPQDNSVEECPGCLCRPCINNGGNHQM